MNGYEAWLEKKPNVNPFKIFICLEYVHVVDEKRRKFNAKSEAFIFLIYYETLKTIGSTTPKLIKLLSLEINS